jgi:SAM-dependent methyltransferase
MTNNVSRSFKDKWEKNSAHTFQLTLNPSSEIHRWIVGRNGFDQDAGLAAYLADKRRILDAGCGNGRVTALLAELAPPTTELVGIDLVAAEVAAGNLQDRPNVKTIAKDILGDLNDLGEFDFIYCQEVLHHTSDPRAGFHNLVSRLAKGGEIAIYVYKQKAPAREFVDDYIRDRISDLPYDQAMEVCGQITEFGRALAEQNVEVTVPAVPVLGIEAGRYPIQRLLYHFFLKCFWNNELTPEENTIINYDWYHPQLATRHTLEEVANWFAEAGLEVVQQHVDPYGITMRGRRSA